MDAEPRSRRVPPLWPWFLFCGIAAAWVNLGSIHRYHTGDNLVPALMSVYRWTPFFWSSNHPGMLVPLLASPIKDLLTNLLVQDAINIAFGLSSFFLLARYTMRNGSYPIVAGLGVAGFLALSPGHYSFDFLISSYHGTWLALALGGLVLLEPREDGAIPAPRRLAALGLLLLAHWIFVASSVVLGPLVIFRALLSSEARSPSGPMAVDSSRHLRAAIGRFMRSEAAVSLRLMAVATGLFLWIMLETPSHHQLSNKSLPLGEWPEACTNFVHQTWMELTVSQYIPNFDPSYGWEISRGWPFFLMGSAFVGLLSFCIPAVRSRAPRAREAGASRMLATLVFWLYMGTRSYISELGHFYRYFEPGVFLAQGAVLVASIGPFCEAIGTRARRGLSLVLIPLTAWAISSSFGMPSLSGVRADLDQTIGDRTADLIESKCTHVVGDYYEVVPAQFHVNMTLQHRGEGRTIWGISGCSRPTVRLWRGTIPREEYVVALISDPARHDDPTRDPSVEPLLNFFRFPPLSPVERRPSIWVMRPESALQVADATGDNPGAPTEGQVSR
jgi:hypothetical protein